ncbi:MAG: (2Fe-2S)-binding protein [Planctomycetes bacterium]|nr:(2Fe-2S)-binding protein [Planctomycetota bacterium]
MPKIIIDGQEVEFRQGVSVLQAALDAGVDVPHYCYHPGLSVVASCRLCLMEMKMPHPQTRELSWAPKLFPACQTPARKGLEVRFDSDVVRSNQRHLMEFYLLNHPLDCPVCDQAGECHLQDYSERFGSATSRMVEEKYKNPKKDVGPHTLLYQDRCVLCTRCVRFCDEVSGTGELRVVKRGSRAEIDVAPGIPLDNPLQGNVVDLCPVGALLNKEFLFKQRVWNLRSTQSICPGCSRGCSIHSDHDGERVYRLRPRYNEKVNEWWICDEGRFGWDYIHRGERLSEPRIRRAAGLKPVRWEELPQILRFHFRQAAEAEQGLGVAALLSPMMSNEEAWLLGRFIRTVAPQATLALGPVPCVGQDRVFPKGFTIKAEKCPNRYGVERILKFFGQPRLTFEEFVAALAEGGFSAAYLVGGYPGEWVTKDLQKAVARLDFLVVHDLFPSGLDEAATVQIPGASWAEREGSFCNCDGLVQHFARAIVPREGVRSDGQFFYELCGEQGLYRASRVREELAGDVREFTELHIPQEEPQYAH